MALHKLITIDKVRTVPSGLLIQLDGGHGTVYGSKSKLKTAVKQAADRIANDLALLLVAHQIKTDGNLDNLGDIEGMQIEIDTRAIAGKTIVRVI